MLFPGNNIFGHAPLGGIVQENIHGLGGQREQHFLGRGERGCLVWVSVRREHINKRRRSRGERGCLVWVSDICIINAV
jgi:hypothetical protein